MVMELGSARWTSNAPRTFARAPGAGLGYSSGFAVSPAGETADDILVIGKGPFTVKREPVPVGTIPGVAVNFRFTDRGTLTKEVLDKQVKDLLAKSFKVSVQTLFKSERVTWRWQKSDPGATFYFPVIATPASLAGVRYSGNHVSLPVYEPSDLVMSKLPNEVWIYSIGVTSKENTMSDSDAAKVLSTLKQAMVNMASSNSYSTVLLTLKGLPPELFNGVKPKPVPPVPPVIPDPVPPIPDPVPPIPKPDPFVKAGFSALILLVAYNMIAPHIGSERL